MVSYNRVSLARKKELDQQDKVSVALAKVLEFAVNHRVKLIGGLVIVFLAISVFSGVLYFRNRSEAIAFNELNKCETKYGEQIKTSSPEEIYNSLHADYQRILDDHPGTVAAKMARIRIADICYSAERFDDAVSYYQDALSDFSDDPFLKNLILNGLAYSFEALENHDQAIKHFEMLASDHSSAMRDNALYNLARIYSENGDAEKSIAFYKTLFEDHPDSIYNRFAEEKLSSG